MTISAYRTLPNPEAPRVCSRDAGFRTMGKDIVSLPGTSTAFTPL